MTTSAYEDAIKRFLRKISPDRDWQYIGEVEHVWMTELHDELVTQVEAENSKLRELCKDIWNDACRFDEFCDYVYDDGTVYHEDELLHYQERMRKLGIEVY